MKDGRRDAIAMWVGGLGSFGLHAVLALVLSSVSSAPPLEFEFELPSEVEFGLTEAVAAATGVDEVLPSEMPTEEPGAAAGASSADAGVDAGPDASLDAGLDAGPDAGDAGPGDAGVDARDGGEDAEVDADPDASDATEGDGGDASLIASGPPTSLDGAADIPAGAQLAIRFDMARVRASPLAFEVRQLLAAIPDWRLILEGSGIDPLDDLERLMLASPNLQRAQLVMAGRHNHPDEGTQYIRDVVQRFGEARSVPTRWRTRHGVPVANWPNEDETARVLAIVGPRHFTISRPTDLQRILSIAQARERDEDEDLEEALGADALLSMGSEDAFSVEVEGARNFIRSGNPTLIPMRLRAAVRQEADVVAVRGVATFENEAQAEAAARYWSEQKDRYARNAFVVISRLNRALNAASIEAEGNKVRVQVPLTESQARLVLGYAEGMVRRPRRRRRNDTTMSGSNVEMNQAPMRSRPEMPRMGMDTPGPATEIRRVQMRSSPSE